MEQFLLSQEKVCFKCQVKKPLSEFYAHKEMSDGHLGKCKDCAKADVMEHREANLEKIRAYDRERSNLPHRVEARAEYQKFYRANNREKYIATGKANRAARAGKIKKEACVVCGKTGAVEKHHPDYSKPLDVVWLCRVHHSHVHHGKISLSGFQP